MTAPESIRDAIASGEFEKAHELWNQYAAGLQEALEDGSLSVERLEEARHLVEWSRLTVQCARSHAQDQLNTLHAAQQYDPAGPAGAALIRTSL